MAKPTQEKKRSRASAGGGDRKAVISRKKQKPVAVVAAPRKQTKKKPQEVVEESEDDDEDDAVEEEEVDEENDDDDGATTATADSDGGADEESGEEDKNGAGSDDEEDEETAESDSPVEEEPKKKAKAKSRAKAAAVKKPAAKSAKTANGRATKKPATKAKKAVPAKKVPVKKAAAAKPKPKPKPKPVVKKRKVRSQEDKILENEPMNKPFYVETGSEWHATDIDFDELSALRSMWELPSACHILWLLQNPLTLRFSHKLLDFEAALLNPASSTILEDVFTKLLLKKSERDCLTAGIGLKYEWWNKQLREYYMVMYDKWYALLRKAGEKVPESFSDDEDDEDDDDQQIDVELSDDEWMALDILKARLEALGMVCPLKHKSFVELPADLRCKILHNLCEAVIDDPTNTEHVRMMEEDDMRVEPLGCDRAGNFYYFFPQFYEERRLYRLELATKEWGLWAKGDDCFRALLVAMKEIRGRKVAGEQELIDHLEVIIEQIEEEALEREKEMEKANKRAILEAIPRKRSVRIQVKQIEQMEQQKQEVETKQQLSMEELADLKRAELLRKVEMEAEREARELEKEAKRVEQELKEREVAAAERELRRQRRLEKEKEEEAEQRRLEAERQKEKEARELRAKLRKAAEEEARLQDQIEQIDDEAPKSTE